MRLGLLAAVVLGTGLSAQIGTELVAKRKADFTRRRPTPT
jgi:hypothetical protein